MVRNALCLVALLMLAGCQTPYRAENGEVLSIPMPAYAPGTVVVHRSGLLEEVVEAGEEGMVWTNNHNRYYGKPANFVAPYSFSESGERRYRQSIYVGDPDELWPLGRGKWIYFGVARTYDDGRSSKRIWRCRDRGPTQISNAGRSETVIHVRCTVYRPGFSRDYPRLQKDYYYSPRLNHLRLTETRNLRRNDEPRRDWVLDVLPPGEATVSRIASVLDRR